MILRLDNVYAAHQSVSLSLRLYEHKMLSGPCLLIKVCNSLVRITFAVVQRGDGLRRSWTESPEIGIHLERSRGCRLLNSLFFVFLH